MPDINKSFRHDPAKYFYVTASGSQGSLFDDEELEAILDFYEEKGIDVRVFKFDQDLRFSNPSFNADRQETNG